MGIQGLLRFVKHAISKDHVKIFKGQKVAIDMYCWLHRACYGCAADLCQGKPTKSYINYCIRRLDMLEHFGVIPVAVFDGGQLPMKLAENEARRSRRKENLEKGLAFARDGNDAAARDCFNQAVSVTPQMAYELIKILQERGIKFVVAPFEADSEIAHMINNNLVYAVITEDSDHIPLNCSKVLFKMDEYGHGELYDRDKLFTSTDVRFTGWSDLKFLRMCILAGCDYLPNIRGMGVITAHKILNRVPGDDMDAVWLIIAQSKSLKLTKEYIYAFHRAELTFLHQIIWHMTENRLVNRTPLPSPTYVPLVIHPRVIDCLDLDRAVSRFNTSQPHSLVDEATRGDVVTDVVLDDCTDYEFLGPVLDHDTMLRVCTGEIDPFTHEPFAPVRDTAVVHHGGNAALDQKQTVLNVTRHVRRPGRRVQSTFTPAQLPAARNIVKSSTDLDTSAASDAQELLAIYSKPCKSRYFETEDTGKRSKVDRPWSIPPPAPSLWTGQPVDLDRFKRVSLKAFYDDRDEMMELEPESEPAEPLINEAMPAGPVLKPRPILPRRSPGMHGLRRRDVVREIDSMLEEPVGSPVKRRVSLL